MRKTRTTRKKSHDFSVFGIQQTILQLQQLFGYISLPYAVGLLVFNGS